MSRTAAKNFLSEVDGWIPVIERLIYEYDLITAAVYGRVWRYSQMRSGVCRASLPTIADDLGLSRATVRKAIIKLVDDKYLVDLSPDISGRVHTYKVTDKIKSPLQEIEGSGEPLQEIEGSVSDDEKPLQEIARPIQDLEGYPSSKYTGPLQEIATNHNSILKESLSHNDDSRESIFLKRPAKAWIAVKDQLKMDMPKAAYDTHVSRSEYLSYSDGTFVIQVMTAFERDWLQSRLSSTVIRLLTGIMNQSVDVVFVEQGATND